MHTRTIILALLMCLVSGFANAQIADSFIHEADVNNISKNATYVKKDGFDGNPNKQFLIKCISSCTTQYGVWYDDAKGLWAIVANDRNAISEGAKFEVSDREVFTQFQTDGKLTFDIDLLDMKNNCAPYVGISITTNFKSNDESIRDLEFPMSISKTIYNPANSVVTISWIIDRPFSDKYSFNLAIDKAKNDCYVQGVGPEYFRDYTSVLTMNSLAERIIEDVTLSATIKIYGRDIPIQIAPSVIKSNGTQIKPPQEPKIPPAKFPKVKLPTSN